MRIFLVIVFVILGFIFISGIKDLFQKTSDGDFELVKHSNNDGWEEKLHPVKNYFLINKNTGHVYHYQNARWEKL